MPKNQQNKRIKTALNHCNQFLSIRTEALKWLQITTDQGNKFKVKTEAT